jgi:hypothetical protein
MQQQLILFGNWMRRCQARAIGSGLQCQRPAIRGRLRCRNHGGRGGARVTERGWRARELIVMGFGAREAHRITGVDLRHLYRLRVLHRRGELERQMELHRERQAEQVARERRRVQRRLARVGIFPITDESDFSVPR